nr:hypothetical protein [uncultured Rhodopila sp.]
MKDNDEKLITREGPQVGELLVEFKQAGVMPNGFYDIAYNEEVRRQIWAGQSPDGKRWDENMPEGELARPWNGASDARIPMVDGVCNDDTALLSEAFYRGELRATAVNPDRVEMASGLNSYLHWLVHTKYRRPLKLEVELAAQYSREHGFAICYVGWERELCKRKLEWSLEELKAFVQMFGRGESAAPPAPGAGDGDADDGSAAPTAPGAGNGDADDGMNGTNGMNAAGTGGGSAAAADQGPEEMAAAVEALILDPEQEEAAAVMVQEVFRVYVQQVLGAKGYDAEEMGEEAVLKLAIGKARKCVRELRETGETDLPVPYVSKNKPVIWVGKPYMDILAARGTMELQKARAIFLRRWFTEAELIGKLAEGWDEDWIEQAKNTKGAISSWAGALGATSLTGPSTKTVGNTTYLKVTEENNPLIEVVFGYVRKVDEDGVTGIWETIFSPHVTAQVGQDQDFCASHKLLDYAHGMYPFIELKRENIGRALTDTRSVPEIAGTWQLEVKNQHDMLYNRAQLDTLPPIRVPTLGGVDYKIGPGAQIPMKRGDVIEALELHTTPPDLALKLMEMLNLQRDAYFGLFNAALPPALLGAKQGKSVRDFYAFWGEVLMHVFALTLQYNPAEITRVTGSPQLASLDPVDVFDEFDFGLEFDVQELNPDYLMQKLEAVHDRVLPADAGGIVDRAALTNLELRMLDPRLAAKVVMDKGQASQKVYRDTELQVMKMALGNEAEYTENDPTAPMKLQFLQTIVQSNPKYQQWLQSDQRFTGLVQNYTKNLQMSVQQQQNKLVGRLGVKSGPGATVAQPGQQGQ